MLNDRRHRNFNRNITDLIVLAFLLGLMFSKFLLSLSMFALSLQALFFLLKRKRTISSIREFLPYLAVTLLFFSVLISGLNSTDVDTWLDFVRKRLPFLVLPFVFYILRAELAAGYYKYIHIWIWICFLSACGVLINYLLHYQEFHKAISMGQSIPTPVDHIKFSIFVAFACISAGLLYIKRIVVFHKLESLVILAISVFLFLFLHILAVRSGIAVLYASAILVLGLELLRRRKYGLFLVASGMLAAMPFIAYKTIPGFHRKISYMMYDMDKYRSGEGLNYSDSERLYSYAVGWALFTENPIMGTGIGDLKAASRDLYTEKFGISLDKYPHNQFLFTMAGMGLLGLCLLLCAVLYPFIALMKKPEAIFMAFNIIILVSFIVENTLERSYSTGFYLFFLLCGINYIGRR